MDYWTDESLDALHPAYISSDSGDFECNICFELAQDPIVTLCGHLYCWPCLYEWLQVHSHSQECPVCKALIEEHKLVPIYGRGKASSDPRSRLRPGINIPKRPVGQRPQTAPAVDMDYLRHDHELDSIGGLMPMPIPSARFGNSTLSSLVGAIPALFSLNVHGFHDATVYGATTGVPYLFSGSFHGGYAHGFHHSNHLDGTKFFMKLKTSKWKKKLSKKKRISWPDSGGTPPFLQRKKAEEATTKNNADGKVVFIKKVPKRVLGVLSNLPLAIGEMFTVASLMALGSSMIGQGEAPAFVFQNFPEDHPLFGFFSWKWITLGLDHMFSSPIFLGTLALLSASLMACTYTTQSPLVKVSRRRSFSNSAEAIHKQEDAETLPNALVEGSDITLTGAGYEVFLKGPALHTFKGLANRIASIGVHLALLLVMSGGTLDAAGSLGEDATLPQGLNSAVGNALASSGDLSSPSDTFSSEIHVNRFYVDYDESGEVSQFHTDISLLDIDGKEVLRKTISTGVRRPNSKTPVEIDGSKTVIAGAIGSRDLDLKTDSEVPIVYAGFGSLMLSACISYLSHAQLFTLQDGTTEVVRGKTDRAKSESPDTTDCSPDQVPELVESSCTEESDSFTGIRIQVGIWNKKDFDI